MIIPFHSIPLWTLKRSLMGLPIEKQWEKPHPHSPIRFVASNHETNFSEKKFKGLRDWGRNRERKKEKEKEWEIEIRRRRRGQKPWKDQCDVIKEGLLEDEERVKGLLRRRCLFLLLCLGLSFYSLSFLWFCWVLVSPWNQRSQSRYY